MFKVGQKVVCVVSDWSPLVAGDRPVIDEIYTITDTTPNPNGGSGCTLFFREISSPRSKHYHAGYSSNAFRPIVSTSTKQSRQKIIDNLLTDKQPVEA